jgi:hypothetical protein
MLCKTAASLNVVLLAALFFVATASAAEPPLSVERAHAIVSPLYEALNEPAKKDVAGS